MPRGGTLPAEGIGLDGACLLCLPEPSVPAKVHANYRDESRGEKPRPIRVDLPLVSVRACQVSDYYDRD